MQMKKIMAAVTAVIMAGSLAACSTGDGNGETTTAAPAADGGDTTTAADGGSADAGNTAGDGSLSGTIKVLHHRTDRDQDGTMAKLTEGFNAKYPNCDLTSII